MSKKGREIDAIDSVSRQGFTMVGEEKQIEDFVKEKKRKWFHDRVSQLGIMIYLFFKVKLLSQVVNYMT
jgi:hypothetical protein